MRGTSAGTELAAASLHCAAPPQAARCRCTYPRTFLNPQVKCDRVDNNGECRGVDATAQSSAEAGPRTACSPVHLASIYQNRDKPMFTKTLTPLRPGVPAARASLCPATHDASPPRSGDVVYVADDHGLNAEINVELLKYQSLLARVQSCSAPYPLACWRGRQKAFAAAIA